MSDGYEPHDHIYSAVVPASMNCGTPGGGRGVPGVVGTGWGREVLYRVLPSTLPGPIFSIFKVKGPTYGQMKAILRHLMRFPR